MKKIIIIFLIALLGLSAFMLGKKILEYGLIKEKSVNFNKNEELIEKLEKVNTEIDKIKEEKKEELERLEEWKRNLEEIKENL